MAAPFLAVEAPDFAPSKGGLLTVANVIEADSRAGMGVNYANLGLCGVASELPETCWTSGPTMPVEGKEFTGFGTTESVPFGVYKGIECWLDGSEDYTSTATEALRRGESYAVARAVRTLILDVAPVAILAGVDNDPTLALAAAEQYAGENYSGVPTIHVTRYGATILANNGLLVRNLDGSLETWLGTPVSVDAGYIDNETTSFNIWISGQVNLWRTPVVVNPANNLLFNIGQALAERLYTATVDCFHGKVVAAALTSTNAPTGV